MKRALLLMAMMVAASGTWLGAADDPKVVYIPHATVDKGGTLDTGPGSRISINTRTGVGQCEVHEKETDTFYVLSGSATFVTGGKGIDLKASGPGQSLGSGIEGGATHHLTKGDVIVIPAGTPHWFKDVPSSPFVYYLVKVIRP
jgi:mannose-6-phosphate isomerase-like protein (cupin superfamily)